MKKIIFLLLLAALALCAACLITYIAAPALAASAAIFKGVNLVTTAFGIPHWIGLLLSCSLLPAGVILAVRAFSARYRKWAAIIFASFAVIYALAAAALNHQNLVAAAQGAAASIQKLLPVKAVDPASQPWFSPAGTPRLFFVHPETNVWRFFRGYKGAHDPATGAELQPVTPLVRDQWQAEQTRERAVETAKAEEVARSVLEAQRQQLQSVQGSLRAEKAARLQDQEAFIRRLLKQVDDKDTELTAVETNLPELPLRSVSAARQKLAGTKTMLANAMTNGTPLDIAAIQDELQAGMASVDQAETDIQAASAARETAKTVALDAAAAKSALETKEQEEAAQLKKLADERHQSELAAQNAATKSRSSQPVPTPAQPVQVGFQNDFNAENRSRYRSREDWGVRVWVQNATRFEINIRFDSPQWQHVWPAFNRAFVAEPGQSVCIPLRGLHHEALYLQARTSGWPYIKWGGRNCGDSLSEPVAFCGDPDPPTILLTE